MRRSVKAGVEELKVLSFEKAPDGEPDAVSIGELILGIPIHSSQFALAAMLKGFNEYYLIPLNEPGMVVPPEMEKQYEHNLALWHKAHPPKSKIIL